MFLTNKHLDRRTFLRGMGATVGLPLLDAMIPARALSAFTRSAVPRMAFVYFPHGAVMHEWTPAEAGRRFTLGRILEPLAPFTDRLTIVSGLENRHAYGPVHAITPGTWLSGVSPGTGEQPGYGITADQVAADHIGRDTVLPSLQLATEAPRKIASGAWEGLYDDSLACTISCRASAPLSMDCSPRSVFETLFARGATADERGLRDASRRSVLDVVGADVTSLRTRLGRSDRRRLRDYLDTVRDVERRAGEARPPMPPSEESSGDTAASFDARLQLMFDLIAVAFQADMTRVASLMMAAETSQMTYEHAGVPEAFHPLSHHQNDPEKIEKLVRIQTYHTRVFASFVAKLADLPDGDGSLLDRSLILYGSNMSDSQTHDHYPLPLAIVGGGGGTVQGGQHLRYADRTPASNVLLTMLRRAGAPAESIGDSTGEFTEV
jgi:hypothetical protein